MEGPGIQRRSIECVHFSQYVSVPFLLPSPGRAWRFSDGKETQFFLSNIISRTGIVSKLCYGFD